MITSTIREIAHLIRNLSGTGADTMTSDVALGCVAAFPD